MYYKLAKKQKGGNQIKAIRHFSDEEYNQFLHHTKWVNLHNLNKKQYDIIVRNGLELDKYLSSLCNRGSSSKNVDENAIVMEGNRLLLNYLMIVCSYLDHTKRWISSHTGKQEKDRFEKMTNILYDQHFEYRFFVRLRNFSAHFSLPFRSYRMNIHGIKIYINRNNLLQYDGWSKVKNEIKEMPEQFEIIGYATKMNKIMKVLYWGFMFSYQSYIFCAYKWYINLFNEIQGVPVILKAQSKELYKQGDFSLQPIYADEFKDIVFDLNSHPDIQINFT